MIKFVVLFAALVLANADPFYKGRAANRPHNNRQAQQQQQQQQKIHFVTKQIPGLGTVRGRIAKTQWSGEKIAQFFDIPYGKSPTGALRFKPSVAAEPWNGVLKVHIPHMGCPSMENLDKMNSMEYRKFNLEHCLRLTVNSKQLNGAVPVMVYIHGEFLYDGSNNEAVPNYLLEEDVVLVSVRYRLGPFGFLSTMTDDIPGNAAVHDVILALQWIQKHISAFGGDPTRVTLFGQVGGAALINVLTMSPAVPENLFHRVIYQSASAMTPYFFTDDPLPATKAIARRAGCNNVNKVEAINKCLRKLNTTALLSAYSSHVDSKIENGISAHGAAQMVIGGPSGILPEHPGKLLVSDDYKGYPTLGGSVKNAGSFLLKDIYVDDFNETIVDDLYSGMSYVDYIIQKTNGADPTGAWTTFAKNDVFTEEQLKSGNFYEMVHGLIDLCSTIAFKNPVLLAMQSNAKKMPNATFLYSFDYMGGTHRYVDHQTEVADETAMPFDMGVTLTDDNLYLFPWPRVNSLEAVRDIKVARRMVALWTSFAATGVPTAPGVPKWPCMTMETGPYLKIGETVTIGYNYVDEYNVTTREATAGHNLVNEEFFNNLVDVNDRIRINNGVAGAELSAEQEQATESDYADSGFVLDFQESRGGNLIFIARPTRQ